MAMHGLKLAAVLVVASSQSQPLNAELAASRPVATTAESVPAVPPTAEQCIAAPTADNAAACDSLFSTMIEYQKMMNKEQREDRRLQRDDVRHTLDAKAATIKADNKAIEKGMTESREKADALQQGAGTVAVQGVTGAISTKPPASADACRLAGSQCAEPCQQPPCD